jgi:hypothetical protein
MSKKEKFSNFMEKLGQFYIYGIIIAICGYAIVRAFIYNWEVQRGRDKFYQEIYHNKR